MNNEQAERIEKLEATLKIIRTWAVCEERELEVIEWDEDIKPTLKLLSDIVNKCDEVLREHDYPTVNL